MLSDCVYKVEAYTRACSIVSNKIIKIQDMLLYAKIHQSFGLVGNYAFWLKLFYSDCKSSDKVTDNELKINFTKENAKGSR